jgi:hypothetical protein
VKFNTKIIMLLFGAISLIAVGCEAAEHGTDEKTIATSIQQPTKFDFSSSPYTEVVTVENSKADDLYFRAREWFSRAFKSSNNVLQMDSKERMILIGKGTIEIPPGSTFGPTKDAKGFVHFTITVYLKDGRYKYEIADATHETSWSRNIISAGSLYKSEADGDSVWFGKINGRAFEYIKTYSAEQLGVLVDSLKLAMSKADSPARSDNW